MIRTILILLALAMAAPAAAQDRMTQAMCQDSVQALAQATPFANDDDPVLLDILRAIRTTPDGWCQLRAGDLGSTAEDMDGSPNEFEWRMEGTSRWTRDGIPPLALQIRARGMDPDGMQDSADTDRPLVDAEITLRQDPDAGVIILENAVMYNDAGDLLTVSAVFERVFLSSPSMMQVSMGSATFKAGLLSMTLDGTHENPFGFNVDVSVNGTPQSQRDAAFDTISRLPDGLIDDASRAELTAYVGDLPKPVGTLEVSLNSERGLGLMQVGMSMYRGLVDILEEEGGVDGARMSELEILFDGLTLRADWTPSAQVAD